MPKDSLAPQIKVKTNVEYNHFPSIVKNIRSESPKNVQNFCERVVEEAKLLCPVRTGFLRDSIVATQQDDNHWDAEVGAPYGAWQEYGTRFFAPHPYMVPAVQHIAAEFGLAYKKIFQP